MKIIVKNGEGRPINLGKFYSPQWASFESTVERHDCPESTEDGEYEAYQVMQEHLPFYQENEWTDCVLDGYDPIVCVSKGSETRVIWRIVSQPQEKKTMNYQPLFDLMSDHGLTLLEGEMDEIINCVNSLTQLTDTNVAQSDQKEEAKTVEGNQYKETVSWDELWQWHLNLSKSHSELDVLVENLAEQNTALMEENAKLREALAESNRVKDIYVARASKLNNRYGAVKFGDELERPFSDYARGYLQGLTESESIINP